MIRDGKSMEFIRNKISDKKSQIARVADESIFSDYCVTF